MMRICATWSMLYFLSFALVTHPRLVQFCKVELSMPEISRICVSITPSLTKNTFFKKTLTFVLCYLIKVRYCCVFAFKNASPVKYSVSLFLSFVPGTKSSENCSFILCTSTICLIIAIILSYNQKIVKRFCLTF